MSSDSGRVNLPNPSLWHAVFQHSQEAMLIITDMGQCVAANAAACTLFAADEETIQQMNMIEITTAVTEALQLNKQGPSQTGTIYGKFVIQDKNGLPQTITYRITTHIAAGYHLVYLTGTPTLDQLAHYPLYTFLENSPAVIYITDENGRYLYANPAALAYTGATTAELIGRTVYDMFPTEVATELEQTGRQILAQDKQTAVNEVHYQRNGQTYWFQDIKFPFTDANGNRLLGGIAVDITAQKQLTQDLHLTKEQFRSVLETIQLIGLMLDPQGHIVFCNDYLLRLTDWQREEIIGQNWFTYFIPQGIRTEIDSVFQRAISSREFPPYYENAILTKYGDERLIAWNNTILVNDSGQCIGITSIGQDITDRKLAEKALAKSTEELTQRAIQLALLNKLSREVIAILNQDDLLNRAVGLVHRYFDYHHIAIFLVQGNMLYLHAIAGIYHDRFSVGYRQPLTQGINGWVATQGKMVVANDVQAETRYVALTPNHNITRSEICLPIILGDSIIGVLDVQSPRINAFGGNDILVMETLVDQIAVALDNAHLFAQLQQELQERQRTEGELRRLYQAMEQSPASVIITDTNGIIQYVNSKFEKITGYTSVEAVGQRPSILKSGYHDNDFYKLLWDTILYGEEWHGEFRNKKKNGELFWEFGSISPIKNESGQVTHFVAVKEDITERKDLEEKIRQQDRLAAVGQLAAGIAHDFNNIMAVISLYGQLLLTSAITGEKPRKQLNTIVQQAQQATDLIQQILDFSRQSVLARKPLNLLSQVKEITKLLQRTLPENIDISLFHNHDNYLINADPIRVQQMIMNLCVNARDAMPTGGQLQISLERQHIVTGMALPLPDMQPGEWQYLRVADSGTGILPQVLPHIFEPFFTTKERGKGTGLGLAQVYGIVKQHEGFIDVTSHPGIGTTFHIYLPALQLDSSRSQVLASKQLTKGHGELILVIEDNEAARLALMESLEIMGYTTVAAENGRIALSVIEQRQHEIQLIVSDVIMPELGGIELVRHMNQEGIHIPIILLTGHLLDIQQEELKTIGIAAWLPKPATLHELSQIVHKTLVS